MDIFLSHSNHPDDLALIDMLALAFKSLGINMHVVERSPQPGKDIGAKIIQTMDACDEVLVLYTTHAQGRKDVEGEIGLAKASSRPTPPVFITEFPANKSALVKGCEDFLLDRGRAVETLYPAIIWFKAKLLPSKDSGVKNPKSFYTLIELPSAKVRYRLTWSAGYDPISAYPEQITISGCMCMVDHIELVQEYGRDSLLHWICRVCLRHFSLTEFNRLAAAAKSLYLRGLLPKPLEPLEPQAPLLQGSLPEDHPLIKALRKRQDQRPK